MTSEIAAALQGCANRDESALHALLEGEGARFMGVALRMLRRQDLAEDALREAMVRIWHEVEDGPATEDWAFSVLRQQARAVLRDGARLAGLGPDDLGVMQQNRQYLAPGEAWRFLGSGPLRDALAALDTPLRQSILLVHSGGFTLGEIAAIQKVPMGVAHGWLAEGLAAIADAPDCAADFAEGRFTRVDAVLLPLDLSVPPAEGADRLWPAIAKRLEPAVVVEPLPPAPVVVKRRLPVLPFAAAAGGLVIGALAMLALPAASPVAVAVLLSPDGVPQAVIEDFANGSPQLRLLADLPVPEGQVAQVWTRPSLERGAVSLGLVGGALAGDDLPAPSSGQRYEITLEPEGGAPDGRPSGPALAAGTAALQP